MDVFNLNSGKCANYESIRKYSFMMIMMMIMMMLIKKNNGCCENIDQRKGVEFYFQLGLFWTFAQIHYTRQGLSDVYETLPPSYRCLIDPETTPCVPWGWRPSTNRIKNLCKSFDTAE